MPKKVTRVDEPPSNKNPMGAGSGVLPARSSLVRRFAKLWDDFASDNGVYRTGAFIPHRRLIILKDIPKGGLNA